MSQSRSCSRCQKICPESESGLCADCQAKVTEKISTDQPTIAPQGVAANAPTAGHQAATIPPQPVGSAEPPQRRSLGDYELVEEIGRGGMGVIYKARHTKVNRIAAVKVILGGQFTSSTELQRFYIEAQAAANLDHPGIVPFYEIAEDDGQTFFAMKYVEGGSLADQVTTFQERPDDAAILLAKVARAVHHAHQRGILHRDLKPANILMDSDTPLLTDLGLAKDTAGDSSLTQSGAVMGTPNYMAPEQAAGKPVTIAADIYGLGAILYEMLTGRTMFQGANPVDVLMQVINGPAPDSPRKLNAQVDRDLNLICMKCLAKSPEDRYASAQALAEDLEAWHNGESISVRPPSLAALASRWYRQNRRMVYFLFASLVAFIFVAPLVGMFFLGEGQAFGLANERVFVVLSIVTLSVVTLFVPSIGFLNTLVAKPTSWLNAIGSGCGTALILSLATYLFLGWMIFIQSSRNAVRGDIQALTRAVWAPEETTSAENLSKLENRFPELKGEPDENRARVVLQQIQFKQITSAGVSIAIIFGICVLAFGPIVYGSLIAYVLIQRGMWLWVAFVRYTMAWWLIAGLVISLSLWIPGTANFDGTQAFDFPIWLFTSHVVLGFLLFLVLRRWRRRKVDEKVENSTQRRLATEP